MIIALIYLFEFTLRVISAIIGVCLLTILAVVRIILALFGVRIRR